MAAATGTTAIVIGSTESDEMIFPDGSHRKKFGLLDGYLFQQP